MNCREAAPLDALNVFHQPEGATMKRFHLFSLLSGLALAAAQSVHATPLASAMIDGPAIGNCVSGGALVACAPSVSLLDGNAAAPGGNLTLNALGGVLAPTMPVTTVSGQAGGHGVVLQSLVHADWFDSSGGTSLAERYLQGAATYALGSPLSAAQLALALAQFDSPQAALGGLDPWQFLSDPNLSYVDLVSGILHLGLAGYLDATSIVNGLVPTGQSAGLQVSDVIKVSVDSGPAQYLYGFFATPSGLQGSLPGAMTGNYDLTLALAVPEPGSLALLSIGLACAAGQRRRQPRDSVIAPPIRG
jgi:hypothetical protein